MVFVSYEGNFFPCNYGPIFANSHSIPVIRLTQIIINPSTVAIKSCFVNLTGYNHFITTFLWNRNIVKLFVVYKYFGMTPCIS